MATETRTLKGLPAPEIRSTDGGGAQLVGYAAKFNHYSQDLGGFVEQIAAGAFDGTLQRSDPVIARGNHDPNWMLGSTRSGDLRLNVDDTGLRYEVDLDVSDPDAVRAMRKVETGKMPGSSFRFLRPKAAEVTWSRTEQGYPLRTLKQVTLVDVGPVFNPAYKATEGALQVALRSLAEDLEMDLDELVTAAQTNELRSLTLPGDTPSEQPPAAAETPLMLPRRFSGATWRPSRTR